jgi:DNA-binding MarR family transcriptional regulator
MGIRRGAITKLAERPIAKLLIVREASASDDRAQTLALTDLGSVFVLDLARLATATTRNSFKEFWKTLIDFEFEFVSRQHGQIRLDTTRRQPVSERHNGECWVFFR